MKPELVIGVRTRDYQSSYTLALEGKQARLALLETDGTGPTARQALIAFVGLVRKSDIRRVVVATGSFEDDSRIAMDLRDAGVACTEACDE